MANFDLGNFGSLSSVEEIADALSRLQKQLEFMTNGNIGSKNVREIGDFIVGKNTFMSRSGTVGMSSLVTGANDVRFWAGNIDKDIAPWRVYEDGSFNSTLGNIGGWVVGATSLKDVAGTVGMSSLVTGGDDIRFWAGNATPASAPFRVTEAGVLTASSGTIGGFTITAAELTAVSGGTIQNKSAAANKVYLNDTGFHANDAAGVERLTIGTTPTEGAKALIGRDSAGTAQSVYTYDTAIVDASSRTGQFITAHGSYILIENDGFIRIQDGSAWGLRIAGTRPELNDGFGWYTIAKKTEVDAKASSGATTSSTAVADSHNHGFTSADWIQCYDSGGVPTVRKSWVAYAGSASHSHTI